MLVPSNPIKTAPTLNPKESDVRNMLHAIYQVSAVVQDRFEGGVPIGAALVRESDGVVIGVGRNRRVQQGSAIRHGETDCLENIGRLSAQAYRDATIYSTLSPCPMCSGAIILYGIKKVVLGENESFLGGESILRDHGVEVVNLDSEKCKELMREFIRQKPEVWNEVSEAGGHLVDGGKEETTKARMWGSSFYVGEG
ncbi:BZ3500_MvSof-1268-A1-R1_Chr1-1g01201 [Microbotryum saponariae]|uniref:Cytosine deaminase n=1 Tax=Microbotryum saponariae TaxID=289078 RepID=A0A2X0MMR1_9BASI|nr:BZ3500_MvSof-1268-A1-R1_Chr1-1g01201 [Microbotryum saponariae]SCZ93644.1 BZ3501_MvSof-1269-A2-R1_Chr1-1g00797 [Microbotryum saponariae]